MKLFSKEKGFGEQISYLPTTPKPLMTMKNLLSDAEKYYINGEKQIGREILLMLKQEIDKFQITEVKPTDL